eukprot:comp21533_c0_seq1/m.29963 comp21533_c0_seq1/g.29963  ORF comp21533_c0_seq1/g.29963 comp21533_c0_seq1/m.29963 type:complete len:340 (-) comp21533_c0_seq1:399-1418(-)
MGRLKVFTGRSCTGLAENVCRLLNTPVAKAHVEKSEDNECDIEILDKVRDDDVFILQSGSGDVNDSLMELCIMIQACKMAAAKRIVAVLSYYPYSKQSKKKAKRRGIPAKLVADMLRVAGASQVMCLDLHANQIQGFFDLPCDNLSAEPFLVKYIRESIPDYTNAVILAKNAGGAKRAVSIANRLKVGFAIIHREYQDETIKADLNDHVINPEDAVTDDNHEPQDYGLVGNVRNKIVIIVDDMLDSAESFVHAAKIAKRKGSQRVYCLVTHGIFADDALEQIAKSPIHEVVATNSIPQEANMAKCSKLRVIDISPLLTEAVRRIHHGESLSFLNSNIPF